jgi:histone demethylase JARID1
MLNEELALRKKFTTRYPPLMPTEQDDDQTYYCSYTNEICYLSRVVHNETGDCVSLGKFLELDVEDGELSEYSMIVRRKDQDFEGICKGMSERASMPSQWYRKVAELLLRNPRPPLKTLKSFVTEGDKIQNSVASVGPLKSFVETSSKWAAHVKSVLSGKSMTTAASFQKLLDEAATAPFWCPEIPLLYERAEKIVAYAKRVDALQASPDVKSIEDFSNLLKEGKELRVSLPETEMLSRIVARMTWSQKTSGLNGVYVDMEEVNALINEGRECGIGQEDRLMQSLTMQKILGEQLEARAEAILSNEYVRFEELDGLLAEMVKLPVGRKITKSVRDAHKKYMELVEKVDIIHAGTKKPTVDERPTYTEVKKLIEDARTRNSRPNMFLVERDLRIVEEWMRKGKRIFGKGNAPLYILRSHLAAVEKRNRSCFSLNDLYGVTKDDNDPTKVFCICRCQESGMMVECDVCHEW